MERHVTERSEGRGEARALLRRIVHHLEVDGKGLFLFCGRHYRGPVVAAAIYPVLEGRKVVVVDGGNMFDPYVISRVARMVRIPPDRVLPHFFVSRAFTCHQLENLVVSDLKDFMKEKRPATLIVVGLLNTFYDSDVPAREAEAIFRRVSGALLSFSRRVPVMVVSPPPPPAAGERKRFFYRVLRKAKCIYTPEGEVLPPSALGKGSMVKL